MCSLCCFGEWKANVNKFEAIFSISESVFTTFIDWCQDNSMIAYRTFVYFEEIC